MKIVILTSSLSGMAAYHLPWLSQSPDCEICMVIYNEGQLTSKKNHFRKKITKMFSIGLLGALNGIRMRKWFNKDQEKYVKFENVDSYCSRHGISFRKVSQLNSAATRDLFRESGAEIGLSLGNGYIGKKLFTIPRYGMLNVHHEILPDYQNAQSIIWQLYNGSSTTGYTIHKIDEQIDTGEIVYQQKIPIVFEHNLAETVAHTSAQLLKASALGLLYVFKHFDELFANARQQGKGRSYTTPSFKQYRQMVRNFRKLKEEAGNSDGS